MPVYKKTKKMHLTTEITEVDGSATCSISGLSSIADDCSILPNDWDCSELLRDNILGTGENDTNESNSGTKIDPWLDDLLNSYPITGLTEMMTEIDNDCWSYNSDLLSVTSADDMVIDADANLRTVDSTDDCDEQLLSFVLDYTEKTAEQKGSEPPGVQECSNIPAKRSCKSTEAPEFVKEQPNDDSKTKETKLKKVKATDEGSTNPDSMIELKVPEHTMLEENTVPCINLEAVSKCGIPIFDESFVNFLRNAFEFTFCSSVICNIFIPLGTARDKILTYQTTTIGLQYILSSTLVNVAEILRKSNYSKLYCLKRRRDNKLNVFMTFITTVQMESLDGSGISQSATDLFRREPEWERDELPKLLNKLKIISVTNNLRKNISSKIIFMILEDEIEPCLIFTGRKTYRNSIEYDIRFYIQVLDLLYDHMPKPLDVKTQYSVRFCKQHLKNLARYFLRILREELKDLKMKLLPELFSLQDELYRKPGVFLYMKSNHILIIIYSVSNLHRMLRYIDRRIYHDQNNISARDNHQVLSLVLFMRELLLVPFLMSLSCHAYVVSTYLWLCKTENLFLVTNDILYVNPTNTRINPFSTAFFYFFFVAHFYEFPARLFKLGDLRNTKNVEYLMSQLSRFCTPYFIAYNVPRELYPLRPISPATFDQIYDSFSFKSYNELYVSICTLINHWKFRPCNEILFFIKQMVFCTHIAPNV
ncbi:hypothetical protein THOM_0465 [Trachipleistophora hominis]|uniref:Uncharacterized protein n=1 Tax=Trachipleistophora hominis TaxID=72359 RepID=L7JYL3_TRAHO|nr:hypothetical protein THOM_0465 [Trachipleistophora hominis]